MQTNTHLSIREWSPDDRPREKLLAKGVGNLSDAELLAILIGSGTRHETAVDLAKRILTNAGNNLNELGKKSVTDLQKEKGIGQARAITIIAAMELGKRRKGAEAAPRSQIKSSREVYDIMHPLLADLPHEEFWVLLLNRANRVVDKIRTSQGGWTGTVTDTRMILKLALEKGATGIILCHNHPSGNSQPSEQDNAITRKIREAASLMEIALLDHLVISDGSYYSFADEGKL
jgi:DNA repair protein RadC